MRYPLMLWRQSKEHLASVNEGYFEHSRQALGFAASILGAGCALVIHAFVPGWFKTTGSRTVFKLNTIMQARAQQTEGP